MIELCGRVFAEAGDGKVKDASGYAMRSKKNVRLITQEGQQFATLTHTGWIKILTQGEEQPAALLLYEEEVNALLKHFPDYTPARLAEDVARIALTSKYSWPRTSLMFFTAQINTFAALYAEYPFSAITVYIQMPAGFLLLLLGIIRRNGLLALWGCCLFVPFFWMLVILWGGVNSFVLLIRWWFRLDADETEWEKWEKKELERRVRNGEIDEEEKNLILARKWKWEK